MTSELIYAVGAAGGFMLAVAVFGAGFNFAYKRVYRFRAWVDAFTVNSADWDD